ncbi:MAG: glycosyltransferase family 39 protein [Armatimonadetes bacterium]|nr:glycosyltransferase family 39 protein [Armatimonadota bacterium]
MLNPISSSSTPPTWTKAIGPAIFLLALLVRLWGIGWGLPDQRKAFSYHPDETVNWIYSQQLSPLKGDFDPGFYNYGTLFLFALNAGTEVMSAYGAKADPKEPMSEYRAIGSYLMAGRVLSALAGAGLVWVIFAIGLRLFGIAGGLGASAAALFSPGLSVHSRFATVDMVAALFVGLALLVAVRRLENQPGIGLKLALLGGVFAGLSAGTKYSGGIALLAVLTAEFLVGEKDRWKNMSAAVGAMVAAFILATPGVLLNNAGFMRDFTYELRHSNAGHGMVFLGTASGFLYHLGNLIECLSLPILVLALLMFLPIKLSERRHWWVLAAFAVPYYLSIGQAEIKFLRYVFPLAVVICILFGEAVSRIHKTKTPAGYAAMVLAFFAVSGFFGGGAAKTVMNSVFMAGRDPRDAAADYFKEVGQGKSVGFVSDPWFYTPPLYPMTGAVRAVPIAQRNQWADQAADPKVIESRDENGNIISWDARLVTDLKPDFIVYSSFESDDVERLSNLKYQDRPEADQAAADTVRRYEDFKTKLAANYTPEREFGFGGSATHDMMYIRPRIFVWKRKTT